MKKEYDFSSAKRGSVLPAEKGKTRITIRVDSEILDWFREQVVEAGGGNYQWRRELSHLSDQTNRFPA